MGQIWCGMVRFDTLVEAFGAFDRMTCGVQQGFQLLKEKVDALGD